MTQAKVFVPGKFSLTNKMLSNLRAAGVYEGRAKEMGRRPAPGHDLFAAETEAVKLASCAAWRKWARDAKEEDKVPGVVSVVIFVTGHYRHDPDAWYLLAKPAIDGMATALWSSDRLHVGTVSGRVAMQKGEPWHRTWSDLADAGVPGFVMYVCQEGSP
jgi:hypothetical protein